MNKTKLTISILCFSLLSIVSCKKEGCTDADASNYDEKAKEDDGTCTYEFSTPATYDFNDADGNSTVSYTGQTDRMDMLGELVSHMKTKNNDSTNAVTLNETAMHNMYSNSNSPFTGTGVGDSGKDLEGKTAGSEAIQAQFKAWMTEAAEASVNDSVVGYHQSSNGVEWIQIVEKGLMGACFAYQITENYLTDNKIGSNVENITPEDGDLYTNMEHHWDEGYGYFADNNDYAQATSRYWVKYANKTYMNGLGAEIAAAFRTGRAAINASRLAGGDGLRFHADVLAQRDIVVNKVYRMAAGMAIHYLYDTKNEKEALSSQNSVNHSMSEAYAFIYGLKFLDGGDHDAAVSSILANIDLDFEGYTANSTQILADISTIAGLFNIDDPESFE